jgi:hypothetical protein
VDLGAAEDFTNVTIDQEKGLITIEFTIPESMIGTDAVITVDV